MEISNEALVSWLRGQAEKAVSNAGARAAFVSDANFEAAERLEKLATENARLKNALTGEDLAAAICKRVAELPDRNSPEDWPEAMLVTAEELEFIVVSEILDA